MGRDVVRDERSTSVLGRIDPFCWLLVVPMLLVTLLGIIGGVPSLAAGFGPLSIVVLAFDSWVNRPHRPRTRG